MDLVSLLVNNAEKISIVVLLMLMVLGFIFGKIVPGPTHDRVIKERDKYLEAATRGMELAQRATTVVMEQKKDV